MNIELIKIDDLKPYEKNAKLHPKKQVEQIKESIREFGFNDPLAIDESNMVIEGHGRLLAVKELGYTEVPCIRLVGLTEEQKKAYILVHNKLTMNTDFDLGILETELESILNIDMEQFDFELPRIDLKDGYFGDERERTYNTYNLSEYDCERTVGFYQMPILKKCSHVPKDIIGFNYALSSDKKDRGIHFYLDDYQFERLWNEPSNYFDKLAEYDCVFTCDFSLYMSMPMAMKIWNVYRSRLLGQLWQDRGMKVIPTLQWAERETFDFCFDGIEQGGTVTVSTIGVKQSEEQKQIWFDGMNEAINRIQPKTILVYGGDIGYTFPNDINIVYFENKAFKER